MDSFKGRSSKPIEWNHQINQSKFPQSNYIILTYYAKNQKYNKISTMKKINITDTCEKQNN